MLIKGAVADNVYALVVLYNPPTDFWRYLREVLSNVFPFVVLIDNSESAWEGGNNLDSKRISYIPLMANRGVAYALNYGVAAGWASGGDLVVCFDQDSRVANTFLTDTFSVFDREFFNKNLYGAGYASTTPPCGQHVAGDGENLARRVKTIITSGMFISKTVYKKIGIFVDDYFIDSVDHEYCLRARSMGIDVFRGKYPIMTHTIGEKEGGYIPRHSPVRKYYIFRNVIRTIFKYWNVEFLWACKQCFRLFVELLFVLIVEKDKIRKVSMMGLGIRDALRGVSGKFDNE